MARSKPGYVEVRHPEQILDQFRSCMEEMDAAAADDRWDLVAMHYSNAADSARDLDNLLTDNQFAPLPADWQRATIE